MSQSKDSLENTRELARQQDLQGVRQQVEETRVESRAERHRVAREFRLEPLSFVSEVEIAPSYVRSETSERTVTPPLLRRWALPQGTRIDRNITRKRGTAAATERFPKGIITDSNRETRPADRDEGWFDPSLGHSPLKSRDVRPPAEGGIPVPPEIVITEPGLPEESEKVGTSLPAHISSGLFNPSRRSFLSSWPGFGISQEPAEGSLPSKSVEDRQRWKSGAAGFPWKYSAFNFPPAEPKSRQPAVSTSSEVKTTTSDSLQGAVQVPVSDQTTDTQVPKGDGVPIKAPGTGGSGSARIRGHVR